MKIQKFERIWCEKQGLPKDAFDKTVLLECLPGRYKVFGKLMWHLNRPYFSTDLDIIHLVANCASLKEVKTRYSEYQEASGFLRGTLRFRITQDRLLKYTSKYLS
ncbi:MAG: hypothetical protein WCS94_09565 [Verrucomicrobiota bacterium]